MVFFIFISILVSFCSTHWVMMWISLELNSIAFCSLMSSDLKSVKFSDNLVFLYYSVQLLSSMLILLVSFSSSFWYLNVVCVFLIFMKLGMWPFYKWYLKMVYFIPMNLSSFFLVISFQKVIPIFILIQLMVGSYMSLIFFLVSLNMIFSCFLLKPFLSTKMTINVSSINNGGWLVMSVLGGAQVLLVFVFFYFSVLWVSVKGLLYSSKKFFSEGALTFMIILMSNLGGFPPFSMFWVKVMILSFMIFNNLLKEFLFFMMLVACFFLYNYSWMVLNSVLLFVKKSQNSFIVLYYFFYLLFILFLSSGSFFFQVF